MLYKVIMGVLIGQQAYFKVQKQVHVNTKLTLGGHFHTYLPTRHFVNLSSAEGLNHEQSINHCNY